MDCVEQLIPSLIFRWWEHPIISPFRERLNRHEGILNFYQTKILPLPVNLSINRMQIRI